MSFALNRAVSVLTSWVAWFKKSSVFAAHSASLLLFFLRPSPRQVMHSWYYLIYSVRICAQPRSSHSRATSFSAFLPFFTQPSRVGAFQFPTANYGVGRQGFPNSNPSSVISSSAHLQTGHFTFLYLNSPAINLGNIPSPSKGER